ncbi:MAG TPA: hypothetical protein VKE94_21910, partial [Gemmataceae bacterium]|nr:hypothetical protein [Gemmataceae bacterium]
AVPGAPEKTEFQVAVIEIADAVRGAKGLTHVRVAFPLPQAAGPPRPGPLRRGPTVSLTKGQEGCFFLQQHPEEALFLLEPVAQPLDAKSDTYKKELAEAKRFAKLLQDPTAGLKSKDADERVLTAGLLVARYRSFRPGKTKQESIDAEQSKLILQALADADFTKPASTTGIAPQQTFFMLGLTDKDGWNPPPFKDFQKEFPAVVKKWLQDNAGKYRIQRIVGEKGEQK